MGVPTFFKWLSVKYPRVLDDAIEVQDQLNEDGDWIPSDPSIMCQSNPNGEFDNLYLDMNGIIHPCCHPEGCIAPTNETEMFEAIFAYIDRLLLIVRPRKLLYMAIDGVAPRAKMNQQRTRRFKAASEAEEAEKLWEELKIEADKEGRAVPAKPSHWDSNVITPGTPFFARLAKALRWYIVRRQKDHPGWKGLTVLLSDASVPGEGEHKVMAFIRAQRTLDGYDPNTKHCLCGADADLIMLGLATHEVSFTIIRETVLENNMSKKPCVLCGATGHMPADCPTGGGTADNIMTTTISSVEQQKRNWKPLIFLRLPILREYLQEEFSFRDYLASYNITLPPISDVNWNIEIAAIRAKHNEIFVPDLERCVDDFILMCFFVGNDFLPHLPSLSIHKGSIDLMILLYQKIRPQLSDYLCDSGQINIDPVSRFTHQLGLVEGQVFKAEQKRLAAMKRRDQQTKKEEQQGGIPQPDANFEALEKLRATLFSTEETNELTAEFEEVSEETSEDFPAETAVILKTHAEQIDFFKERLREKQKELNESKCEEDPIRLGEGSDKDWRERYYTIKFKEHITNETNIEQIAAHVARKYAEGLAWVLNYYFQGVCSWSWYFPYYYAPLASDLARFGFNESFTFTLGDPFKPFHQLMAVLPARSRHCLPKCLQRLMTDQDSPIIDFYPTEFEEDPDGKRFRWQWVVKLPFIDENRLISVVDKALEGEATEEEKSRNSMGVDQLYLSSESKIIDLLKNLKLDEPYALSCSDGISIGGEVTKTINDLTLDTSVEATDTVFFETVKNSDTISVRYIVKPRNRHLSSLLADAIIPNPQLSTLDIVPEDPNSRRFNSGAAKRIIIASLGSQGLVSQEEISKYFTRNRGTFQDMHNIGRDNRYQTEMFGERQPRYESGQGRHRPRDFEFDRIDTKRPRQQSTDARIQHHRHHHSNDYINQRDHQMGHGLGNGPGHGLGHFGRHSNIRHDGHRDNNNINNNQYQHQQQHHHVHRDHGERYSNVRERQSRSRPPQNQLFPRPIRYSQVIPLNAPNDNFFPPNNIIRPVPEYMNPRGNQLVQPAGQQPPQVGLPQHYRRRDVQRWSDHPPHPRPHRPPPPPPNNNRRQRDGPRIVEIFNDPWRGNK